MKKTVIFMSIMMLSSLGLKAQDCSGTDSGFAELYEGDGLGNFSIDGFPEKPTILVDEESYINMTVSNVAGSDRDTYMPNSMLVNISIPDVIKFTEPVTLPDGWAVYTFTDQVLKITNTKTLHNSDGGRMELPIIGVEETPGETYNNMAFNVSFISEVNDCLLSPDDGLPMPNATQGNSEVGDDGATSSINVDPAILPVTLASFTATPAVSGTNLRWSTTEETGFDKFIIEKSFENVTEFGSIAEVNGGLTNYNHLDGNVSVGTSYYRLKMVDLDGSFEYSPIVSVSSEFGVGEHIVYPNPTSNRVVKVKNYFDIDSYNVSDLSGKSVGVTLKSNAAAHEFTISNTAANGNYILEYSTNGQKVSRRFTLQ